MTDEMSHKDKIELVKKLLLSDDFVNSIVILREKGTPIDINQISSYGWIYMQGYVFAKNEKKDFH